MNDEANSIVLQHSGTGRTFCRRPYGMHAIHKSIRGVGMPNGNGDGIWRTRTGSLALFTCFLTLRCFTWPCMHPTPPSPSLLPNAASSAHFIIHYQVSEIRFHFPLVPLPPYKYFVAVLSAHH